MKKKIAILLPYKEKYTLREAAAASIWIKDYLRYSKLKEQTLVFGNLGKSDKPITNNFTNLDISKIRFKKNYFYTKKFFDKYQSYNFEIVEIHNRPESLFYLIKKKLKCDFIFIYHNNPQDLRFSKTVKERLFIVNNCKQVYFVSKWVMKKFFEGLPFDYKNNCEILYPSINPLKSFPKKEKIIIFTGKLNTSKGYDIFGRAALNILKKYKDWKVYAIGNERREKHNFYSAHRLLSQLTKYRKNDEHYEFLKKMYKNNKINKNDKTELFFALGKASEDICNYREAFKYYVMGNKIRRQKINFSITDEEKKFAEIKQIFNTDLFNKFEQSGNKNPTPIFILGMPRSGTTLVEQILSSHPKIYGGDELKFLPNLISKHIDDNKRGLFLKDIIKFNNEKLIEIGSDYINALKKLSNNSEKVTDKLPINFKWIGLIKLILPNSKIVHCIRNAKDNCLSIFKNYFVNPELAFAYDLKEISLFYNLYFDLMKHWKKNLPNFVIDIQYDNLVKDPKNQIRRLLSRCNLDWNDNCMKYYKNKRAIKTTSDTQARKKIYKSSVNLWKKYKCDLNKVFKDLP